MAAANPADLTAPTASCRCKLTHKSLQNVHAQVVGDWHLQAFAAVVGNSPGCDLARHLRSMAVSAARDLCPIDDIRFLGLGEAVIAAQ